MSEHVSSGGEQTAPQTRTGQSSPGSAGSSPNARGRLTGSSQLKAIDEILRGAADGDGGIQDGEGFSGDRGGDGQGDGGSIGEGTQAEGRGAPEQASQEREEGRGEQGEDGGEPKPGEQQGALEELSVKELAEKLDLTPSELYKALKVTTGDGETATLEELKSAFTERAQAERGTAERAAELDRREAGLATDIQGLGVLDAMQAVPEGIRKQAVGHLNQMAEREWVKFTQLVPDMAEDANRVQFGQDIEQLLKPYGLIPEHFGVRTAGMLRLIRDVIKDRKTIQKLTAKEPKKAPQPVKRNREPGKKPAPPLTGSRGRQAELEAIAGILKGSGNVRQ